MKKHQISLRQLSQKTGIRPTTLSGWCNGSSPRDLCEVLICARFFAVSLETLLFDIQDVPTPTQRIPTELIIEGHLRIKIEQLSKL